MPAYQVSKKNGESVETNYYASRPSDKKTADGLYLQWEYFGPYKTQHEAQTISDLLMFRYLRMKGRQKNPNELKAEILASPYLYFVTEDSYNKMRFAERPASTRTPIERPFPDGEFLYVFKEASNHSLVAQDHRHFYRKVLVNKGGEKHFFGQFDVTSEEWTEEAVAILADKAAIGLSARDGKLYGKKTNFYYTPEQLQYFKDHPIPVIERQAQRQYKGIQSNGKRFTAYIDKKYRKELDPTDTSKARMCLGTYETAEDAALARDKALIYFLSQSGEEDNVILEKLSLAEHWNEHLESFDKAKTIAPSKSMKNPEAQSASPFWGVSRKQGTGYIAIVDGLRGSESGEKRRYQRFFSESSCDGDPELAAARFNDTTRRKYMRLDDRKEVRWNIARINFPTHEERVKARDELDMPKIGCKVYGFFKEPTPEPENAVAAVADAHPPP